MTEVWLSDLAADFTNTFRSLSSVQAEDESDNLPGPMQQVVLGLQLVVVLFRWLQLHTCSCMYPTICKHLKSGWRAAFINY